MGFQSFRLFIKALDAGENQALAPEVGFGISVYYLKSVNIINKKKKILDYMRGWLSDPEQNQAPAPEVGFGSLVYCVT